MDHHDDIRRHGGWGKFLSDFRALFIKTFLLARRKRAQTIIEIFLAYTFIGLLLGMRYILDRRYNVASQLPRFRPMDTMSFNGSISNTTYYYPANNCTTTIVNNAVTTLTTRWAAFPNTVQVMSDPTLNSVSNTTLQLLYAFIYFTNLDSCTNPNSMPDEVKYTLRMQENGPYYYRAQRVKLQDSDILWKRAPEDFCQTSSSYVNYTTQFLGVQYAIDSSIIQYVTNIVQDPSSIYLNHFGCPEYYVDQLQSIYSFFVSIFFSIVFLITFIMNVGYIVEERENKTKEYLRIFGLRTWINNLVWVTRAMCIYIVLTSVVTGLSLVVLPSSGSRKNSVSKAIFNFTHWTLIWTILFVYSIQVSTFSVLFGQFFKRPLLAKLLSFLLWVLTFIDFYPGAPVGVRYFMCMFPNTGLLFCLEVILQYERKSSTDITTFANLYTNLFTYPLHIGICLLMMLIYSVIYMFLAIYIERINPGEFGISQAWNYPFKRSFWSPQTTASIRPLDAHQDKNRSKPTANDGVYGSNRWIELDTITGKKTPTMTITHLTKKFGKFKAVSNLSLDFYPGEVCSLLGHNGAGKTTTTFILVGMLEPSSGTVMVEGLDNRTHIQKVRKTLGFCPQYDILYGELSVYEHLELVAKMRHLTEIAMKQSIESILRLIGLGNDRQTLSKNLSGGMKRRLSIGISMIGDPKVVILDEPTSGIDPYNRRLIWTIIRKMKEAGKCVILTTHFLEEADVLSDRIAIMTSGRLQANGTPDFLKNQTEFEYRLFIEKHDVCDSQTIIKFIQARVNTAVLEQESASELTFGIKRGGSKQIGKLIDALDEHSAGVGINSYGLSMTTIEEVFLRLVREEEEEEDADHSREQKRQALADRVFRTQHERISGARLFWSRVWALLVKRWIVSRRQLLFLIGFFLAPILIEIIIVAALPTPQQIQASLLQNDRIKDAQVTLVPSIYDPQTIVTYSNNNGNNAHARLVNYLINQGATLDEISNDTVLDYVRARYLQSEDVFVNKYQIAFGLYNNLTSTLPSLTFNAYFSTVNYHTMATSLGVSATQLFQFYANSSSKSITTTNEPVLTTSTTLSAQAQFFEVIYCFDTLPLSLFNFLNSVLVSVFTSILIMTLIQERVRNSKDLQLLTNLTKRIYWLSNTVFDMSFCFLLCSFLTIIVKIAAIADTNTQAETYIYRNNDQMGYFFVMLLMYSLASLPFMYVYSFSPKTELIGFINFFLMNVIACFLDMVLGFISVFSQGQSPSGSTSRVTKLSSTLNNIRWIVAVLFPSVNFKRSLFNIRIKSNPTCVAALNSLMNTNLAADEPWMSLREPGIGIQFVIFVAQMVFWWLILTLIENWVSIKQALRRYCGCGSGELQAYGNNQDDDPEEGLPPPSPQASNVNDWSDSHLDEDVRNERRLILQENESATSAVVLVRDLVQRFKKRKQKSLLRRVYTAVDHLNFRVPKKSCFGLLGANGAGKTTTFRMLINDLKPTSGDIFINGKNINKTQRDLEIGFCPQFDWLVHNLNVFETLVLFARLKGLRQAEIPDICRDMMELFGLDIYGKREVQKLSGGNKRKVSAALAFMANPALVFLDEPTTGLDAAAKRKLWDVIRAARDVGLTIIMTSHSMEECEALCTKIGIMKLGQFMCLGNLQRLKNRFGNGYAVQVKVVGEFIEQFKSQLLLSFPGIEIEDQHNGMLFCNVPFATSIANRTTSRLPFSLARVFEMLDGEKELKVIESYSVTQTTLEQIFVRLAGEDDEDEAIPIENTLDSTARTAETNFQSDSAASSFDENDLRAPSSIHVRL